MIRVDDLSFTYPRGGFTLAAPSFRVESRETVAIVGPSGSGKSTLLNLLAGVVRPSAGRIEVDGVEVSALGDRAARAFRAERIGFVFQDFGLLDYLSARDNVLHPYRLCAALRLTASGESSARRAAADRHSAGAQ